MHIYSLSNAFMIDEIGARDLVFRSFLDEGQGSESLNG